MKIKWLVVHTLPKSSEQAMAGFNNYDDASRWYQVIENEYLDVTLFEYSETGRVMLKNKLNI